MCSLLPTETGCRQEWIYHSLPHPCLSTLFHSNLSTQQNTASWSISLVSGRMLSLTSSCRIPLAAFKLFFPSGLTLTCTHLQTHNTHSILRLHQRPSVISSCRIQYSMVKNNWILSDLFNHFPLLKLPVTHHHMFIFLLSKFWMVSNLQS